MAFEDYAGQGLAGAGTGAATGAMIGGPWGAAIGGGLGLGLGLFQGHAQSQAREGREEAQRQLEALKQKQYAQRMQDLQRTMSYFGPVDAQLQAMYGSAATGTATPPEAAQGYFGQGAVK